MTVEVTSLARTVPQRQASGHYGRRPSRVRLLPEQLRITVGKTTAASEQDAAVRYVGEGTCARSQALRAAG